MTHIRENFALKLYYKTRQVVDTFSSSARGVVFVVDSGTVTKQVRDQ